jgi:hypothetical protein
MTICDNSRPYEIVFEHPSRVLVFGFANQLMHLCGHQSFAPAWHTQ